jgi:2-polyprenyl-3-methyl-5-hydroxy-6-metoxy-1,4-benzoquinol methylase
MNGQSEHNIAAHRAIIIALSHGKIHFMIKNDELRQREEIFHDSWAEQVDPSTVLVDELSSACTMPETRAIFKAIGNVRDKHILELGCGCGEASVYFAKHGAKVTATDISSGMLDLVRKVARHHGADLETRQCPANNTELPAETFDIVYAANLLHHVNVENTVREAHRLLKPGGIFAVWDPIAYNPMINVYRRMATSVRTSDEHPLRRGDVALIGKYFPDCSVSGYWLCTLSIFVKFYLLDRIDPNKERYWKKIVNEHRLLRRYYNPLELCDRVLLSLFPFLKWLCWNIVILGRKAQPPKK